MSRPEASLLIGALVLWLPTVAAGGSDASPDTAVATWAALASVQTLEAHFVQVRTTHILSRPVTSKGVLRFARPGKMAWVVSEPGRSTFIVDGTRVGMAYPDLDVREEIDLSSSPEVAYMVAATTVWIEGDLEKVRQDYDVGWVGGNPATVLLKPRAKPIAEIIATLELTVERDPTLIRRVLITEPDGDTVEITFSEVHPGAALAPDAFSLP